MSECGSDSFIQWLPKYIAERCCFTAKKIIYPSQTMQKVIFYSFLPKVKKNFLFVKYDSDDEKNISYNQR